MATEKLLLGHLPRAFTPLHGFIMGNTLAIYNIHYYIKRIPTGISVRADWSARHKWLHPLLLLVAGLLSLICLFFLPASVVAVSAGLGVLSLGYSLPILPFAQKKRLKDWGILKLILLALVWTCVTVLMPMLYWQKSFEAYEVELLLRFVFMLPLCIAFDIRDMETDKEHSIYTLPNIIGVRRSLLISNICLILFGLLAAWQYLRYPIAQRFLSAMLVLILTKIMLHLSRKLNSDVYYLLLVDGMMLVYALLVLLG